MYTDDGSETPDGEGYVAVEVDLPPELIVDLDAYATTHGYGSLDAVVSEALWRQE